MTRRIHEKTLRRRVDGCSLGDSSANSEVVVVVVVVVVGVEGEGTVRTRSEVLRAAVVEGTEVKAETLDVKRTQRHTKEATSDRWFWRDCCFILMI
jgi:hypothetical protein